MTRTAIRHTLTALTALALVTAFTGSPASAQGQPTNEPRTPNALATKKRTQATHNVEELESFKINTPNRGAKNQGQQRFRTNPSDIALPNNRPD